MGSGGVVWRGLVWYRQIFHFISILMVFQDCSLCKKNTFDIHTTRFHRTMHDAIFVFTNFPALHTNPHAYAHRTESRPPESQYLSISINPVRSLAGWHRSFYNDQVRMRSGLSQPSTRAHARVTKLYILFLRFFKAFWTGLYCSCKVKIQFCLKNLIKSQILWCSRLWSMTTHYSIILLHCRCFLRARPSQSEVQQFQLASSCMFTVEIFRGTSEVLCSQFSQK